MRRQAWVRFDPSAFWLCSCRHPNTPVYYADEIDKLREYRDYHWEQINRLARAIGMLGCKTEDVISEAIHMLRGAADEIERLTRECESLK